MERGPVKDLYTIIGAEPGSSPEEIRAAYLARARILHPDRFDQQRQPQDWKNANNMMAELNEAYAILRSLGSRSEYGQSRPDVQCQQEESLPPAYEPGEPSSGQAGFAKLPKDVQSLLLRRQDNIGMEQFQIRLDSVVRNFVFTAVLACWFWYLFADAGGALWKGGTLLWHGGLTLAVGFMLGLNLVRIRRWNKASLTSYFYVTPLYFIKTEYDTVSFRPIWMLKGVSLTHHRSIGPYRRSGIVFKFDNHDESMTLTSKRGVETLFERLRQYDARVRVAFDNHDEDYIFKNDDFFQVPRMEVSTVDILPGWRRTLVHMATLVLCGISFFGAMAVNQGLSWEQWISHPIGQMMETIAQDQNSPQLISVTTRGVLQHTHEPLRIALGLALLCTISLIGARITKRDRIEAFFGPCNGGEQNLGGGETCTGDDER